MGNYYAQDFDPWVNNIRRIGTMLAQMPERRALLQERQQTASLRQAQQDEAAAHAGEFDASARKLNAEATDVEGQSASGDRLSVALKKVMANPNDPDATGDAISEFGHYFKKNPEEAAKGMGQLVSQLKALQGSTNFAQMGALQGNAASIANNQATNARIMATPMNVPDNNIAIDKVTGQPIAAGLARLSMGQRMFAPKDFQLSYDTQPAAQGAPEPAKSSAATQERNRYIGSILKSEPDPLKQQALIRRYDKQTGYKPDIDVSATVTPLSSAVAAPAPTNAPASASVTPPPAGQQPPSESPDDLVPVTNPQGKPVRIKRSQLSDALSQGYKTR